jgi:hypothetical protein
LQCFTSTLGANYLQNKPVLFKDPGTLAKLRDLVVPIIDLANSDFQNVVGDCVGGSKYTRRA